MNNIIIEHHHQDTDYDDHGHLEEVSIAKGGWEAENEISFWMFRDWLQDRTWFCHFIVDGFSSRAQKYKNTKIQIQIQKYPPSTIIKCLGVASTDRPWRRRDLNQIPTVANIVKFFDLYY